MKNRIPKALFLISLISLSACAQNDKTVDSSPVEVSNQNVATVNNEPHRYGGYYCPDNLNGFPAIDIKNWKDVPVVNGRMPTQEETQNGTSLINVDMQKYPNAKPLDITMPKLARFYNEYSKREDLIIIIQAVNVDNDSIVGFRYLNGGNGSARLEDVKIISENEIEKIPTSQFVTQNILISSKKAEIAEVLKKVMYTYPNSGNLTASYKGDLFGNFYIQNDYDRMQYNEKFLLIKNELTNQTELKIVCGPYTDDFAQQKININKWALSIKRLSEK